ncbi:ESCRT-0 subunit protein hse1 [Linnemannia schmuckeri]|uniref:ESCRT-0 subunit protein hse1 n=1 Tax=Linnemannia schmuckeri TaxID=64567 RepID=A0A9P5RZZ7_9FUNG|nr:ESCRT-0 subunit protein hse1 [Linnemannia schmuckeri]
MNNVQYASTRPLTTLQHESQESRPSIDTELQMLVVPPKSTVVPVSQSTPSPPSSNSNSNNAYHSILNHQTAIGRPDSDSDEEDLRDSDLAHQERLLRQEQNTDIITGELDNLVAASATDLEESEVGVLEGADEDDDEEDEETDDEETEVQLERSLSSPSQKPELPPLLFSKSHSYDSRPNSFDFTSAPLTNPTQERTLDAGSKSSGAVAPLTVVASDAAAGAVPHSHPPPSQGSIHSTSNAAVTSPSIPSSVAPAQAKQDALSLSTTATAGATTTATTTTTTTTTTPVALPPPSANLERYEQHPSTTEHHNFAPAHVSSASPVPAPIPASTATYGATSVASSVTASGPVHANVPVTFQHTAPASTGSVYSPSYSTPAQEQPTIYNPNQAVSSPAPVVYQPPALAQTQQTVPRQTPATVVEEHVTTPQVKHGHEHSYSRHPHDASASTAFSNDGKDSMTSLDSGKPSEQAPTPPPKEEYQKSATYQPPASTQSIQEVSLPAPVGPSPLPDPTLPQPLAMPVQAYQLYQPKPYQPKSKPSVKQPPKQAQVQEAAAPAAAVQPENQIQKQHQQHQQQPSIQSQPQSQSQHQPQPQHQEQAQAPFQLQGQSQAPTPGLAQQSPEQQQQQFQHQYHLQQQYQAQQQMQQQQQQQQPWAGQQHPPIHTGPEVSNVGNSGPPSAASSANESTAASKPAGKGWMSGIRTSFMPKASKKDSKEAKEAKNQHAAQDSPSQIQVAPAPLTVQPQAPFGHQQQFEGHPGQYGHPPLQYGQQQQHQQQFQQQQPPFSGGQVPGQGGYNGANFANSGGAPGSSPVSQRENTIGTTPGSGALPAATTTPAHVAVPGRQDSFQSETSAQAATPQFQQQPGLQQQFQQQQFQQQQQQYQQQQAQQQQFHQQHQSPYATNAVQPTLPAVAPVLQQHQQPPAAAAPSIVAPTVPVPDSQGAQANDDKAGRRLSSVSNSSFNNASLRPETIEAANAASAAIQAARLSTSSASLPGQVKVESPVASPYQQQQQQQQQQPMVAQQEQRQQAPGSPLSDAGSRISVQSGASEVRNLEVIARAQAMFDFPGEDPGDLPFKVGDIINVIEFLNDDWWRGTLRKELGIFPTAYVQKLNAPANGTYPKISVTVRQSMIAPSPTEQAGFASSLQQQASFRASYQPSSLEPATSGTSAAAPIPTSATGAAPGPDANVPGGANFPTPPPASSSFPAPPPGSSAMSPTASSVFTYFPTSGNQPPISPPPSLRNQNQRLPFAQGQPGQENYGPSGSQPLSPISPQQNRFSQQPPNMMQFQQQPGQPVQPGQQQYQQYGQAPYQYNQQQQQQQQQPLSPTAGGSVGSNSQMTTAQMAAAVKPKKKFGTKW